MSNEEERPQVIVELINVSKLVDMARNRLDVIWDDWADDQAPYEYDLARLDDMLREACQNLKALRKDTEGYG